MSGDVSETRDCLGLGEAEQHGGCLLSSPSGGAAPCRAPRPPPAKETGKGLPRCPQGTIRVIWWARTLLATQGASVKDGKPGGPGWDPGDQGDQDGTRMDEDGPGGTPSTRGSFWRDPSPRASPDGCRLWLALVALPWGTASPPPAPIPRSPPPQPPGPAPPAHNVLPRVGRLTVRDTFSL